MLSSRLANPQFLWKSLAAFLKVQEDTVRLCDTVGKELSYHHGERSHEECGRSLQLFLRQWEHGTFAGRGEAAEGEMGPKRYDGVFSSPPRLSSSAWAQNRHRQWLQIHSCNMCWVNGVKVTSMQGRLRKLVFGLRHHWRPRGFPILQNNERSRSANYCST